MNKREIIFLGSVYPEELKKELQENKAYVDYPGDVLQHAILKGFDENNCDTRVLSSVRISGYSMKKKLFFNPIHFSHNNNGKQKDLFVGGINLPYIYRAFASYRLSRCLKKQASRDDKKDIVIYAIGIQSLLAMKLNRKRIRTATLIVPDLPEFMSENRKWAYRLGKKVLGIILNYLMKDIDGFVLLSPYMRERLPIGEKPWIHMEGIYSPDIITSSVVKKEAAKTILYTGNIGLRYGILDLLDAFELIESPNYKLWIRGNGNCKQMVLERAKRDKRISYFEPMSREDLLNLQRKATVLVNPVRPSQEFTKFFFPSKTMEYLASGTPTVMYKLDCLPKDYCRYVYIIPNETIESLRNTLVEVCEKSNQELEQFGSRASGYIKSNKTPKLQSLLIVSMIEGLVK